MNDAERLTQAVNQSGFPLQIAIAHLVRKTAKEHKWNVLYSEHAWKNENKDVDDGSKDESGFIDLILERSSRDLVLIVECKRVLESEWVFLIPKDKLKERRQVKSWTTIYQKDIERYEESEWRDRAIDPQSYQSEYCVVHGQDSKATPMLERIGGLLVESTEGFAAEELSLKRGKNRVRIYFNVVVTTAKLMVCELDPEKISVSDGKIKDPQYFEVPFIRFRKQLSVKRLDRYSYEVAQDVDVA